LKAQVRLPVLPAVDRTSSSSSWREPAMSHTSPIDAGPMIVAEGDVVLMPAQPTSIAPGVTVERPAIVALKALPLPVAAGTSSGCAPSAPE
jgi:hypothetical protein